ncbi:MAG: right-handed parallel beta-helix repeat-containing protein [Planctomycetota bacterium]|nr:right-handed parallel beta-helix repeat-containing protein [Planctomycetota bacterium]
MNLNCLLIVPVLSFTLTVAVNGATIHVDAANCPGPGSGSVRDPYCSIQTAIDNAVDTDEVVVAAGTYFESINFLGKAIWLHSSDGAEVTVIDGTGFFHVVQCVSSEGPDTILDGFTITGGHANGVCCGPDSLGGGMYNEDSSPTVINCTFDENAAARGGGMYNFDSSPTVANCTFNGNSVAGAGGGMYNRSSSPTITNCTFSGNSVTDIGGGGGMFNFDGSSPTITNCTFSGNVAFTSGGGITNSSLSIPTITNCTFSGNVAGSAGEAIYSFSSGSATVTNCIVWGNGFRKISGNPHTITYSDVEGGWPGIGNIGSNPMFVDPNNGNYRLQSGSPCIDTGDNTAVPEGVLRDLDGNPRFVADACAGESGATVDMGAYEFQGTSCDLGTMLEMLAAWGSCSDCGICPADLDGDCSVGILDLLILLGNWG